MKRYAVLLLFTLGCFVLSQAQIGTWQAYMSYYEPQQIVKGENNLYVLASNSLYQYNLNDQSITTYDKITGLSDTYITHIAWNQQTHNLIIIYQNSNIDLLDANGNVTNIAALYKKSMTEDKTIDSLTIDGVYAYLYARFAIIKVNMQRAEISDTYRPNHPQYPTSLPVLQNNDYDKYLSVVKSLNPGGPKYNYFYNMKFDHHRLYTVGGYFLSGKVDLLRPGTVQVLNSNDWQIYEDKLNKKTGFSYLNNNCVAVDPTDENHVFVGGRCGLYEFKDGQLLNYYTQDNSPLHNAYSNGKTLGNDYNMVDALEFDSKGNLWVINSHAKDVNLLLLKSDGQWENHYQSKLNNSSNIGYNSMRHIMIDSRGYMWFANVHWQDPVVFCYDIWLDELIPYYSYSVNGENYFTNQDGVNYNVQYINAICEDRDHNILLGTSKGLFMIASDEVGQSSVTFQQIKVPRNDGSNFADYLMNGVDISAMVIDGGNRKWIGTNGNGVYLISADNMEQIHHFTTENSPLLSNTIESIAIDGTTGKVFFGTDEGLCSYMSDATEPVEEMQKDDVYAYPNPVEPGYTGLITIVGLSFDADVKILSPSGKLVSQGRSNGGTYTWDGCDLHGKRVASGVYMVSVATNEGKSGVVSKIAIIN